MEIELPKNPSLKGILFDSQIRLKKFLVIFLQILIIFFFFLVHMRILRERDKENFCFRKQKLKASIKSKIEIKLYYLKIPYLESRIPKIPSREKGRGETEIERERGWGEERGGNIPSLICTIDSANSFAAEKNPFVFPRTFREM